MMQLLEKMFAKIYTPLKCIRLLGTTQSKFFASTGGGTLEALKQYVKAGENDVTSHTTETETARSV